MAEQSQAGAPEHGRISSIDAWRLVAVSMVIVGHIVAYSHPWFKEVIPGLVWRMAGMGTYGVLIFFCISGFVICRGLIREQQSNARVSLRGFYIRRFFRIVPPLALYLLAVTVLSLCQWVPVRGVDLARSATFLCNVKALGSCGWFLGHTWSLAYEEQFYVFFPLLFAAFLAHRRQGALTLTAAFMGLAMLSWFSGHDDLAYAFQMFVFMLCGCCAALYLDRFRAVTARIGPWTWAAVAVLTPAAMFWVVLPEPLHQFLLTMLVPPAVCVIVLCTPTQVAPVAAFFDNRRAAYLGKISFTVYLWQQLATANYAWSTPWTAVPLVGIVWLFAHWSFAYFERPLIARGSALSNAASAPACAAADSAL